MRARFEPGELVQVLDLGKSGHIRTPRYIRLKTGRIVECCGCFLNPEDLAAGRTAGPAVPLYRVSFRQADLWTGYAGPDIDSLFIEIYEHWLRPAAAPMA